MTNYVAKTLPVLICLAAVLLNAEAFDVTEKRVEHIDLTEKDIVKKEEMVINLIYYIFEYFLLLRCGICFA